MLQACTIQFSLIMSSKWLGSLWFWSSYYYTFSDIKLKDTKTKEKDTNLQFYSVSFRITDRLKKSSFPGHAEPAR